MITWLNSEAIIPSSDTIHNDIIKIFEDEKEFLKKELQVYYILYKLLRFVIKTVITYDDEWQFCKYNQLIFLL